jgi:lambda family phage portal protein
MKILGFEFGRSRPQETAAPRTPAVARGASNGLARRRFDAAFTDRLVHSWTKEDVTVNQSLHKDLRLMRARSRDFFRNNEYGRKFSSLVTTNIVGHAGFTLKVDCRREDGSPEEKDSKRIKAAWTRFAKMGNYDVTGKLSEAMFDKLAILAIARDGEVLIRKVEGRGIHGAQLQMIRGDVLDEELNRDLEGGGRIRMGIEFDVWMKPVAYYFRKQAKSADIHGSQWSQYYDRVDAKEILHLFMLEEVDQWRGVPWAFAALRRARQLDQFNEAALVAANVGAAKMGFFQQKDPEAGAPINADEAEEGASASQDFTSEATPGQFDIIPDGYELTEWDPNYPNDVYDPFTKAIARALATGCLVSYHGLTGDLTQVNFSSIRSGTIDEREMWKMVQGWYIQAAKEPIFEYWLARAMMNDADLRQLPYAKFDKFNSPVYFGRRWDWVDPRSEAMADAAAVALGTKSRAQLIRDRGRDPDEVWAELKTEEDLGFSVPNGSNADQQDAQN